MKNLREIAVYLFIPFAFLVLISNAWDAFWEQRVSMFLMNFGFILMMTPMMFSTAALLEGLNTTLKEKDIGLVPGLVYWIGVFLIVFGLLDILRGLL